MSKIIVSKKVLTDRIAGVEDDGFIELVIVPSQFDRSKFYPAFLHLAAIVNQNYVDLEYIDESPVNFNQNR